MEQDVTGRLAGQRVIVTGGGRGIGRSIALLFAEQGADVVIAGRSVDQLDAVVDEAGGPGRVVAVRCDVTDDGSVAGLVERTVEEIGPATVLVNNAGVHAAGSFMDIEPEVYTRLFDVNVVGAVRLSQRVLPAMIEAGYGRIVNIASTAGLAESPGQAPYNASKHAFVGLTRCMALELAPTGVTANAICPGFVDTPMVDGFATLVGVDGDELRSTLGTRTPMGRILQPDEVAHLALYLASDISGGMTGQTLAISNGMRMR